MNQLGKLKCIDNCMKIGWDVRTHPAIGTLEFRMFDVSTKVEEAVAIAALAQAIIVKLYRLYESNMSWRLYRRAPIEKKKWSAARYGIERKMIKFGKKAEGPMGRLISIILEILGDAAGYLGD